MTTKKAIRMIDEYLAEPNSIHKDWIEVLILCRQALVENDRQKAEIYDLKSTLKEFAKRVQKIITIKGRQKDYFDNLVKEMVGE